MYPIRKTTKNWILPAMVLRPCVQLNTGEYNLRLQTAPAKLYNKSTDISRKRWSEQMDMENLILGHYSVAFTMDTYVHSMDEHKRCEMDKMNDMFGMQYSISVENQPYPVLCTLSADGCTAHVPDFPKVTTQAPTLDATLLEVKQQIQKALRQYKNPPIPTKQEQIVVPNNSVLVLVKAS